jgi:peptidoglycan/xylan/chitin deacetylase (PgdA/CDA1 family)
VLNYIQIFFQRISKVIHPEVIWNKNRNVKTVYLTFDDGPTPIVTARVLEILDQYKIKATFFCIGKNVEKHPDIFASILERGHTVGNHTMQHLNGWKTSKNNYLSDVYLASQTIKSTIFRPPYGKIKPNQLTALQNTFKIVMWDVITYDYNQTVSAEFCLNQVKRFVQNGSIIVFHDSIKAQSNMLNALPQSIEYLIGAGYEFSALDERNI